MHKGLYPADIAFGSALSFIVGIFVASAGWNLYLSVAILAPIFFFLFSPKWMAVFLGALLCGAFYYHFYIAKQASSMTMPYGTDFSFSGIVSDEPKELTNWWMLGVSPLPRGPVIEVFAPLGNNFAYGDMLQITGKLQLPDGPGSGPSIFPQRISLIGHDRGSWLRGMLIGFKSAILRKYGEFLTQDQAQLLGGITLGASNEIAPELKDLLMRSGTSYIMAMYGYKIGVLAFAISGLFAGFLPRRMVLLVTLVAIVLFVMMAGAGSSAMRAGIMASLALLAAYAGRMFSMRNAITLTAFGMLLFDPTLLMWNAGFELSFLSLLGIVYLGPSLRALFGYNDRGILRWKENVVVALSAIIAIIPVAMALFGGFSITAVFSNALIGIAIPATMMLGAVLGIGGFISYYFGILAGRITALVLWYELSVMRLFAVVVIPLPMIFNSPFVLIIYYLAIGLFIFLYGKQKSL